MSKQSHFPELRGTGLALWIGGLAAVVGWPLSGSAQTQIEKVRVGRHAGYDRIVIDLADEAVEAFATRDPARIDISATPPDVDPATRRVLTDIGVQIEPSAQGTQILLDPVAARSWTAFRLLPEEDYENPRVVLDLGPRLPRTPAEALPISDRPIIPVRSAAPPVGGSARVAAVEKPIEPERPTPTNPVAEPTPQGRAREVEPPAARRPVEPVATPEPKDPPKPAIEPERRESAPEVASAPPQKPPVQIARPEARGASSAAELEAQKPTERAQPAPTAAKSDPVPAPERVRAPKSARQSLDAQIKANSLSVRISGIAFAGLPAVGPSRDDLLDVELPVVRNADGDWRVAADAPGVRLRELMSSGAEGAELDANVLQKIVERLAARFAERGRYGTIVDIHRDSVESVIENGGELVVHISEGATGSE